jgi:hypothetical protein
VRADRVVRGIVQDQGQIIESHDLMKSAGQVMEQRVQIPMGDDGFRDGEKCLVLLAGWKRLCVVWEVTHDGTDLDELLAPTG